MCLCVCVGVEKEELADYIGMKDALLKQQHRNVSDFLCYYEECKSICSSL